MDTTLSIAEQFGRKLGLSGSLARSKANVFFVKGILLMMIVLIVTPYQNLTACACSDIAVGPSASLPSSLNVDEMGELQLPQGDIELPGGVPVHLVRQYQSHNYGTGIFGMGWSVDFVSNMITTTGDLQINFTGNIQTFTASDSYYNHKHTMRASWTNPNEVTVIALSGEKWIFDTTDGTLKAYADPSGNQITYTWKIENVSFLGNTVQVYCPLTMTFPGSRTISFTYSTTTGMTHLCTQASSPSGFTVSYSYTDNLLTGISKSNGQNLAYSYHTTVDPDHSDWVRGWLNKITYADGSEVNITYNGLYQNSNGLFVTNVSGPLSYNQGYSFTYAPASGPTPTPPAVAPINETEVVTNSLTYATTSLYSNSGKSIKITDSLGNFTQQYLNDQHMLTSFQDARGKITTYTYDSSNANVLAQQNLLSTTNPLGKTWNYEYDSNNHISAITDPLGHEKCFTYGAGGKLIAFKNGLNQTTQTNTYTTGSYKGLLATSKDGLNNETDYCYNTMGLLEKITDPAGKVWKNEYGTDGSGNLTKRTNPLSKEWKYEYNGFYKVSKTIDPLGNEANMEYDDMANLTKLTDANGNISHFCYDKFKRCTAITDPLSNVVHYEFNSVGNLTSIKDALNHEYAFSYNSNGSNIGLTYPDASEDLYEYDANKNITKITDRSSKEITFAFDDNNQQTIKTWKDTVDTIFSSSFDDSGKITEITKTSGGSTLSDVAFSYDAADRLVSLASEGRSIAFEYNAAQLISKITYPSDSIVNYNYNSRNLLDSLKDMSGASISSYCYDDASRLTKATLANGLEYIVEYNDSNWLTKLTLREVAHPATVIQSFEYGYDSVGNKTYVKRSDGSGDVYQYDSAYQLTGVKYSVSNPEAGYASATGASRVVSYAYDAVGNRTQVVDGSTTINYTVNNLNQYTQIGSNSGFVYDSNGNLTADGTWAYGYDRENHLISANKSGTSVLYKYDAVGHRVEKSVNGAVKRYIYNGNNLIETRDASDNVIAKYIYALDSGNPVKLIIGENEYFIQKDDTGNVTALTDSTGALYESYSYDAFGTPSIKDSIGNNITVASAEILFGELQYDSETGLYHAMSRAYSPLLGRFLQVDPVRFSGFQVNMYAYVGNNSINFIDPSGKCCEIERSLLDSANQIKYTADAWLLAAQTAYDKAHGETMSALADWVLASILAVATAKELGPKPSRASIVILLALTASVLFLFNRLIDRKNLEDTAETTLAAAKDSDQVATEDAAKAQQVLDTCIANNRNSPPNCCHDMTTGVGRGRPGPRIH